MSHVLPNPSVTESAALEDQDVLRVGTRRAVELGQPPRGDRAAEPGSDDADVDALGHYAR